MTGKLFENRLSEMLPEHKRRFRKKDQGDDLAVYRGSGWKSAHGDIHVAPSIHKVL